MGDYQHKGIKSFFILKFPKHINFSFNDFVLLYTLGILVPVWNHSPIMNAESRCYFGKSSDPISLI